jgi:hypothetical protein
MAWNDNSSTLASDHSTSGGTKRSDSDGYSWTKYSGSKESHDVEADQMNSKDYEGKYGEHTFYSPKSGKQGVAGSNASRKGK